MLSETPRGPEAWRTRRFGVLGAVGPILANQVARQFALWVFLCLAAIITLVFVLLFATQRSAIFNSLANNAANASALAASSITERLTAVLSDVGYLSHQSSAYGAALDGTPEELREATEHLEREFFIFSEEKRNYDQIRFIDVDGNERIRVNRDAEGSTLVPAAALQNKANRPYFAKILNAPRSQIYISPIDLNIEEGQIEKPHKPVMRAGVPVYGTGTAPQGIMIVNYLAGPLLDGLDHNTKTRLGDAWLLNDAGYWLHDSDGEKSFAFMFRERQEETLKHTNPALWATISASKNGIVWEAGDLYAFNWVASPVGIRPLDWPGMVMVTHLGGAALSDPIRQMGRNILLTSLMFYLLAGAAALFSGAQRNRRAMAEGDRRSFEERFRQVAETASDGIVSANTAGNITFFNEGAERIFKTTAAEMLGQPLRKLMPERYWPGHEAGMARVAGGGARHVLGSVTELVGRRSTGEEFPLELSLAMAKTGKETLFTGILRDISRRKQQEDQIRTNQARINALFESVPDGMVVTDDKGVILRVNSSTTRLFGYSAEDLVGKRVEILMPGATRQRHVAHLAKYASAPRTRDMGEGQALYGCRSDGSTFPIAVSLSPVQTDEGARFIASVRDITELAAATQRVSDLNSKLARDNNELEVLNKELEAFSASVSHDLRSPLRAIDGFSKALLEDYADKLDEDGRDYLHRVRGGAQRMGMLIDDLLNLARITRAELLFEEVNLSILADQVIEELHQAEPERMVEVEVVAGMHVRGDRRLLKIALDNLIGNAWKFTGKTEHARIEVGIRKEGTQVLHYVRDNGAGFDMAYADQLFRAFQRLHDARLFPGTGVGLATVQRIMHKHGGRIWAEAEPGQGATFYFTLPQG
ncbi:PAS domain S-box protein [Phaeovulum sp. W22_SRMD_FR3]|uniref:PAS domain S-box protein n=1 Tax=Phaeovulum sp. W22_SRMD_FR3 TaxID=3240274 RepID=UPI003F948CAB